MVQFSSLFTSASSPKPALHHDLPDDFTISELNDPSTLYAQFDDLRARCPVAHSSQYGGYHLLTRYHDVKAAAADNTTFISSVKAVIPSDPRGTRRPPLNYDAPAHTPFKTALERTLKPTRIKRLEVVLEQHAQREWLKMVEAGGGDICADFGAIFSAWVEVSWLNLSDETAPLLARTAAAWVNAWREERKEEVGFYSTKLYDIARDLFADRKREARDADEDPASSLLEEKDAEGQELDGEQLIGALRQSLVVGMVAPPILLGDIAHHLSSDQALQSQLRTDPSLIPAAIEEFIRLYVPYRGFSRTINPAHGPVTMHGRVINPGEPIAMAYCAANRDPEVFPEPGTFVLNRPNINAHLGFGRGRHRCAGTNLARLALQVALRVMLRTTSRLEVNGPLRYAKMPEMGLISCPLKTEKA